MHGSGLAGGRDGRDDELRHGVVDRDHVVDSRVGSQGGLHVGLDLGRPVGRGDVEILHLAGRAVLRELRLEGVDHGDGGQLLLVLDHHHIGVPAGIGDRPVSLQLGRLSEVVRPDRAERRWGLGGLGKIEELRRRYGDTGRLGLLELRTDQARVQGVEQQTTGVSGHGLADAPDPAVRRALRGVLDEVEAIMLGDSRLRLLRGGQERDGGALRDGIDRLALQRRHIDGRTGRLEGGYRLVGGQRLLHRAEGARRATGSDRRRGSGAQRRRTAGGLRARAAARRQHEQQADETSPGGLLAGHRNGHGSSEAGPETSGLVGQAVMGTIPNGNDPKDLRVALRDQDRGVNAL